MSDTPTHADLPASRPGPVQLDDVLTLDLDAGVAVIDLTRVTFVDAYALTGLACSIASATGDGLPVRLLLPERYDVRSWLSRMHLGDVFDAFDVRVEGDLPKVIERDREDNLIELGGSGFARAAIALPPSSGSGFRVAVPTARS